MMIHSFLHEVFQLESVIKYFHLPHCWLLGVHQLSAQPVVEVTEQLSPQHFIHIHQSVRNVHSEMQNKLLLFQSTSVCNTMRQTCTFCPLSFLWGSSLNLPPPLVLCLTCKFWTAPCHRKTTRRTPPGGDSGIYVVAHPPVGSKLAGRPAGKLPASHPHMTRCHPEHARKKFRDNLVSKSFGRQSYTKTHFHIKCIRVT